MASWHLSLQILNSTYDILQRMDRKGQIRKFIRIVLKDWHYPMPRLWFVKNATPAYFLDPPARIRLRVDTDLQTVLHELQHYRDHEDHLSTGGGEGQVISLSELRKITTNLDLDNEAATDVVAEQLKDQYRGLWNELVSE